MQLIFATSNHNKFREAQIVFPDIKQAVLELREIQSTNQLEIVTAKLDCAVRQGLDCVMVEDTSLEMECLGGLPGPFIKFFLDRLGSLGLLDIATTLGSPKVRAVTLVACAIGGRIIHASGVEHGTLVQPHGTGGFGFDSIFLTDGQTETCAQMSAAKKSEIGHRGVALRNLRSALDQTFSEQRKN